MSRNSNSVKATTPGLPAAPKAGAKLTRSQAIDFLAAKDVRPNDNPSDSAKDRVRQLVNYAETRGKLVFEKGGLIAQDQLVNWARTTRPFRDKIGGIPSNVTATMTQPGAVQPTFGTPRAYQSPPMPKSLVDCKVALSAAWRVIAQQQAQMDDLQQEVARLRPFEAKQQARSAAASMRAKGKRGPRRVA